MRNVFGSYDPYRDVQGLIRNYPRERDLSYAPYADHQSASTVEDAYDDLYDDPPYDEDAAYEGYGDDLYDDEVHEDEFPLYRDVRAEPQRARARGSAHRPRGDLADVAVLASATRRRPGAAGRSSNGTGDRGSDSRHVGRRASAASSRAALRRRRSIFFTLLVAFAGSLGAVVVTGTPVAWGVHAGVALLFSSYVHLLVRHHRRLEERSDKVRRLAPARRQVPRPAVVVLSGESGR